MERLVLEAFVEKTRAMPDGDHKVAHTLLCNLHALTTIERDRGWFMEHGRLSSPRSKAISVGDQLAVPQAPAARGRPGDAFDVPPELLA